MRFKVSIEYIQTCDPGDFHGPFKAKKSKEKKRENIRQHIESSIISQIQDAVDGHGYPILGLQESLKYAAQDDLVEVKVKYIDDNYYTDSITVGDVIKLK
jgi:hypothetical protein